MVSGCLQIISSGIVTCDHPANCARMLKSVMVKYVAAAIETGARTNSKQAISHMIVGTNKQSWETWLCLKQIFGWSDTRN